MRALPRNMAFRLLAVLGLAALAGQPVLTHLHGVEDGARTLVLRASASALVAGLAAAPAPSAHHERGDCPLCLARAHSRSSIPEPAFVLAAPAARRDALAVARVAPPARLSKRAPSLRGPPLAS